MIMVQADRLGMELTMTGHACAEHNGEGHDLVCCAASVLVQSLAYYAQRKDCIEVDGHFRKGDARVKLRPFGGHYCEARTAFAVTLSGLEMLAAAYPQHISIDYGSMHPPEPDGCEETE